MVQYFFNEQNGFRNNKPVSLLHMIAFKFMEAGWMMVDFYKQSRPCVVSQLLVLKSDMFTDWYTFWSNIR